MEHECKYHTDHESRIKKLQDDYDDLDDRVTELDKDTAVNTQMILSSLKNLEKLPETMSNISKTMISMQGEISKSNERIGDLDTKFNSLSKKIDEVDEEGKFNIRKWIRDNWIALSVLIVAGFYVGKQLLQ